MTAGGDNRRGALWLTWEKHRRSEVLAGALGVPIRTLLSSRSYIWRVLQLSWRTMAMLVRERPALLIVQNPSLVLASVAGLLKLWLRYRLIVDRHSNFEIRSLKVNPVLTRLFYLLSRFSIRRADLTIVTNEHLAGVTRSLGGRSFILPDKIPDLDLATPTELRGRDKVVCICSYASDEPIQEIIRSAGLIDPEIFIYMTGNHRKLPAALRETAPANLVFTGFLDEAAYQSLLVSCDLVMTLTNNSHTLLCGAYEALAAGKPLVLSDQESLRDYFHKGRVTCENTAERIAAAVTEALARRDELQRELVEFVPELKDLWQEQFEKLRRQVHEDDPGAGQARGEAS